MAYNVQEPFGNNKMYSILLEKAMTLYEQQQQQQQSTPDCRHDFEYDSSYGEIVCFNRPKSFFNDCYIPDLYSVNQLLQLISKLYVV